MTPEPQASLHIMPNLFSLGAATGDKQATEARRDNKRFSGWVGGWGEEGRKEYGAEEGLLSQ